MGRSGLILRQERNSLRTIRAVELRGILRFAQNVGPIFLSLIPGLS